MIPCCLHGNQASGVVQLINSDKDITSFQQVCILIAKRSVTGEEHITKTTSCGSADVVLGKPWLAKRNPDINRTTNCVVISNRDMPHHVTSPHIGYRI